jgi:NAD(P)H-dependent flavin oxidoreductase YrpB (nitropropane dioxygenase family)
MQAPIGGAGGPGLVAAVCNAGALGTIAGSWKAPDDLRAAVADVRQRTDAPFAVNLVLAFAQEERAAILADLRVPVVTFSWGVRPDLIALVRDAGCRVLVQVADVAAARVAHDAGAHGVIAQGIEAGGHVESTTGLLVLVRAIESALTIPVVAAGGIVDGQGVAAARAAGAVAVACGTAFLATEEAHGAPVWKDALVAAGADDTALTGVFDGGWPDAPHRVLRNSTYRAWESAGCPASGSRPGEGDVLGEVGGKPVHRYSDMPPTLDVAGDLEALCLYAGQGVALIDRVSPVAEVVARLG